VRRNANIKKWAEISNAIFSFTVLRSHVVDPAFLKAQRQKEEEKRKREEKKKAAATKQQGFGGFQMGDVWGTGNNNTSGGFGMTKPSVGSFGAPATGSGFGMVKPTAASIAATTPFGSKKPTQHDTTKVEADQLAQQMNQLVIHDPIDTDSLPQFPGQYLYIDEERTDNYDSMGIDMSRYKEYLDMEKELLMEIDECNSGETWQGETYEKQHLPRGVDKQFKKFTERVEFSPSQCVRYEFNGQPLFYSALRPDQQKSIASPCKHCHGPRVFEFQLMPNILSILPTTEYATRDQPTQKASIEGKAKHIDAKTVLDSWNVGMEFGTILVFVCQKDCHQGSIEDVSYIEEAAIVQYETD
jgi:pre-rRNA-processing protein TSR4